MIKKRKHYINVEIVKLLMKEKSISEEELASRMFITLTTIKNFLGGADQSHMSSTILYKLAVALNEKAHSLLHEEYR